VRFGRGNYWVGKYSTELYSDGAWWGSLAGLPWIPPFARALPGSTNFVGTNAQAHLLVMSLMDE